MDEGIESLGEVRIFSTLDASSGYWQVKLHERDRERIAFTSHHGLYQFLQMPFRLKKMPDTPNGQWTLSCRP